MESKDLTLAYDDDTKGNIGSKDVTLAYDDGTQGEYEFLGFNISLWWWHQGDYLF